MNSRVAVIGAVAACVFAAAAFVFFSSDAPAPEEGVAPAASAPVVRRAPDAARSEEAALSDLPRPVAAAPESDASAADEAPAPVVEAAPTTGQLRITTDVPGAQVFIDRQFVGAAPAVAENVTPGSHQLNVSAEGFESYAGTIEVTPGEREIVITFREVRLNSSIEVVHRHGMGSCRGRLIATPQGLRYETTNSDDAFTASLVDLETFQVDYIAKNLRVKLPKGRQFNFTDPDGNADRLFVFHRDVDTARERLRKGDPPATN